MDIFLKTAALVLVAVILTLFLGKWEKNIALLISIAACCVTAVGVFSYFDPVISLLRELESIGNLQNGMIGILIKAVGITLIAEIATMICTDAGNGSLGKMVQILGSGAVLYLSIPILRSVLTVLTDILGEL